MALTRKEYTGDGSTTLYNVDFDLGYIDKDYVYIYLENNEPENQLSYVWRNDNQVELNNPVDSGKKLFIRRMIPRDLLVNNYEDGALLREKNLNDSYLQALMLLQEIQDGFITVDDEFLVLAKLVISQNLDMKGFNIENLGEARSDSEATPLSQVNQLIKAASNLDGYTKELIDYIKLKIFQSPTDGGLTEIQTRTVNANEVYEVRKTSDNSLATIYSDADGTTEIVQNGTSNVSGSDGVVEFYIANGDYYATLNSDSVYFTVLSEQKLSTYSTVLELRSAGTLQVGAMAACFGYNTVGDCPQRNHIVKTVGEHRNDIGDQSWQPNNRLDIPLNNKNTPLDSSDLVAVFKSANNTITFKQCGYNPDESSKTLTTTAVAEGAARDGLQVVFDGGSGSLVDTNHQFDFGGQPIDLSGGEYRFSPGNTGGISNGRAILRDTWKSNAVNAAIKLRDLNAVYRASPPHIATNNNFLVEVIESDISSGGRLITYRKCDRSKYWVAESIVTQEYSGTSTSINDKCDAWRLGALEMMDYFQCYNYTPTKLAAGDVEFTRPNPGTGAYKTLMKVRQTDQDDSYEYEVASTCDKVGVLFLTSTSGNDTVLVELIDSYGSTLDSTTISCKSDVSDVPFVVELNNRRPLDTLTVRVTNVDPVLGTQYMKICGVGCVVGGTNVSSSNVDTTSISLRRQVGEYIRFATEGAQCYAIYEKNLGKFGGESHGGETMSMQSIFADGELWTPVNGGFLTCRELRFEQESTVDYGNGYTFDSRTTHKFYSYPASHVYNGQHEFSDGFTAKIAYGPMLATRASMDKMVFPESIDSSLDGYSGNEERYELGKTEYVRIESTLNPFVNEMWLSVFSGYYNESTPWWKLGFNANDFRKFYYGPVSSSGCGEKDLSRQPYQTSSVRVYN